MRCFPQDTAQVAWLGTLLWGRAMAPGRGLAVGIWGAVGAAEALRLPGCSGEAQGCEVIQGRTRFGCFVTTFPMILPSPSASGQSSQSRPRCRRAQLGHCSRGIPSALPSGLWHSVSHPGAHGVPELMSHQ